MTICFLSKRILSQGKLSIKQKKSPSPFGWSANAMQGYLEQWHLKLHRLSYTGNGNDNCWKLKVFSHSMLITNVRIFVNQSKIRAPLSNRIKIFLILKTRPDI